MGRREEIESAATAHSRTITPAGVGIDIQKQSDFIAGLFGLILTIEK